MVNASALPADMASASWLHCRGPADWSAKEQMPAEEERSPTPAMKAVLKLRKKLREMTKIEESVASGQSVDALQVKKLEKKAEIEAQLEEAERILASEELALQEASTQQQQQPVQQSCCAAAAAVPEVEQPQQLQGECAAAACMQQGASEEQQFQEASYVQLVPVIFCEVNGQQQAIPCWYGYPDGSYADAGYAADSSYAAEGYAAEGYCEYGAFDGACDAASQYGASTVSARRRLRRQRAEGHKGGKQPQPLEGGSTAATASEPPSPRGSEISVESLTSALESGDGEARDAALADIIGSVARLTFDKGGCRAVQAAIQSAGPDVAAGLVSELHGLVRDAMASPFGNYVIQTVITALPTSMSGFVVRELRGAGCRTAKHRFGCRILCRLVEHHSYSGSPDLAALFEELLADAGDLCKHPFAHFVLQCMVEQIPALQPRILEALRAGPLLEAASHRCSSHVLEAALAHGTETQRQQIVAQLLGPGTPSILGLAQSQHGSFVLRSLLQVHCPLASESLALLAQAAPQLQGSKSGQRLLLELGLRTRD